uniref:Uncharacterized protein n=1 Tax=Vitis vinifera TaxID=29760 RepID=F6HEK8_VITVI
MEIGGAKHIGKLKSNQNNTHESQI